jgi:glycosidase
MLRAGIALWFAAAPLILGAAQPAREARAAPEWVNRAIIYHIWLRSFSPEGTLAAVTARLDQLAKLGVNVLYLSPIAQRTALADGGPYNIRDYYAIDPEYGTAADLKVLAAEAHKRGLKIMLDVVFYHAAFDSVLMKWPDFFVRNPDGKIKLGNWHRPVLDFSNPKVREYLVANLVWWTKEFDIDGFRCDVAGGSPTSFWEQARDALEKVKPNVLMLAEADMPEHQLKAFDISYNFTYHSALMKVVHDGEPATLIREQWERMHAFMPRGARMLHYSDNQDQGRSVLSNGGRADMAMTALNATLDGIPFLYNGQEIWDTMPTDSGKTNPIRWQLLAERGWVFDAYSRLFHLRLREPALTAGELIWVANSEPSCVVSFLRRKGLDEVVVIVNLSSRKVSGIIELPVADYCPLYDIFRNERIGYRMYPGKVQFSLNSYGFHIAKREPSIGMGDFDYRRPGAMQEYLKKRKVAP